MAKRKRKAPKRKRRKGRFGSLFKKALGFEPDEEMKKAMMEPIGVALGEAAKTDDFKKKLEEATSKLGDKKEAVKTAANSIRSALETDMKAGTTELTGTKEAIKKTGKDGAEAFYKMIDASGIKDKMGSVLDQAKAKITEKAKPLMEKIPLATRSIAQKAFDKIMANFTLEKFGTFVNTKYGKTKDMSKKIFLHILSKISYKDFQESTTKLLEEAGGAAKAAATAAAGAAKKAAEKAKKTESAPPAPEAKKPETKPATPATTPAPTTAPKTGFGKRKRGPSASLKRMCKKHGVRLTVKRGKKRVYKSSKVLKEQCQRKLKNKLKKNFGRKKIKRSGIMAPRKTRGKKRRTIRKRLSSSARGARRRASAAARYARRNPGRIAGGLAGLGALGLGGYEAYLAARKGRSNPAFDAVMRGEASLNVKQDAQRKRGSRYQDYVKRRDGRYDSPTLAAFRRAKGGAMGAYTYFKDTPRDAIKKDIMALPPAAKAKVISAAEAAKKSVMGFPGRIKGLFSRKKEEMGGDNVYGKRRRRRRRKSKYDFGKKAKKPSAATRRLCKKLKVKMTLKRGGKRVYKSEAMLKKQCKKAMKRKSKK